MTRRRCCCGCETYIWDTFHRDDSTDLGDDWDETLTPQNWSISSNELTCSGPSGICLCTVEAPAFPFRLCVDVATIYSTDEARVYWNWVDSNNHYYWEYTNAVGWKVFEVVGGSETQLYEYAGYGEVGICVYPNYFSLSRTNGGDYTYPFSLNSWELMRWKATSSKTCGVGTGGVWGGTSSFDHFAIMKLAGDAMMEPTGSTPTGVNLCFACAECVSIGPPLNSVQLCRWGTRQQQYTITLPAFTCHADCTAGCTGCSSLTGDYTVTAVPPDDIYDPGQCNWEYVFDPPLTLSCSTPSGSVTVESLVMEFGEYNAVGFSEPYIRIYFTLSSADNRKAPEWLLEDIAGPTDCTAFTDLEIPTRVAVDVFQAWANTFQFVSGLSWKNLCDPDGASATVNS